MKLWLVKEAYSELFVEKFDVFNRFREDGSSIGLKIVSK